MVNVKDQIYDAIKGICKNVSDGYPSTWNNLPAICYTEEDNRVAEFTDGQEDKSYVRYKIDIWNNRSTSDYALQVDENIVKLGLRRTTCQDVADPSGLKHKVMRYEGVIDNHSELVYQE